MSESAYRVETTSRLAQWRIQNLASCTYRKSDPFKMGKWNWHLSIEKKNQGLSIKFYPEISNLARDSPPIASFVMRAVCFVGGRKTLTHTEVKDKQLKRNEDFVWGLDEVPLTGKFIIDVDFIDLKTSLDEGEASSIWREGSAVEQSNATALATLGRMFTQGIHTDITITTSGGSIGAHRAILSARSPVFCSMFLYDLKEKQLSTIHIPDMTHDAFRAFLSYVYGNIQHEEFLTHRLAFLRAADKYGISDLKQVCHESLLEDIDVKNVLERLQTAHLYQLPDLKDSCIRYLVEFGKIYDIRDELDDFLRSADRDLIADIFHEVLCTWKAF
uniref:BTB domain-containing protein n=1 Tax=Kalanchoe fedtschenkoi TaxID=63787 RepID=A0A7N0VL46_KALFE